MDSWLDVANSLLLVVGAFVVVWIGMWIGEVSEHMRVVEAFMKEMRRNLDDIHRRGNTRG